MILEFVLVGHFDFFNSQTKRDSNREWVENLREFKSIFTSKDEWKQRVPLANEHTPGQALHAVI